MGRSYDQKRKNTRAWHDENREGPRPAPRKERPRDYLEEDEDDVMPEYRPRRRKPQGEDDE